MILDKNRKLLILDSKDIHLVTKNAKFRNDPRSTLINIQFFKSTGIELHNIKWSVDGVYCSATIEDDTLREIVIKYLKYLNQFF